MKKVQIQTQSFFQFLQERNLDMWQIFEKMITSEEQLLIFVDEENQMLFEYILPNSMEKYLGEKEKFIQEFKKKLKQYLE